MNTEQTEKSNKPARVIPIFKRSNEVPNVSVDLTWPNIYFNRDTDGVKHPIKFSFRFRRQMKSERDALQAVAFLQEKSAEDKRLDLFCSLISRPPLWFADFPMSEAELDEIVAELELDEATVATLAPQLNICEEVKPLAERAREFFGNGSTERTEFVLYAMTAYDAAVVPSELLFRI